MREVLPVGVFGVLESQQAFRGRAGELRAAAGVVPEEERAPIAAYLRGGSIILAIMEYTTDVLDGKFGVSGGSAVLSDGTYYWRMDAADYVETYGIALDEGFLAHGRALGWQPPALSRDDLLDIDDYLTATLRK